MATTFDKVCYLDGWHWSVKDAPDGGEVPDKRLFLQDDGTYRIATASDKSWHERHHRAFVLMTPENGTPGVSVTADEMAEIQKLLDSRRGG